MTSTKGRRAATLRRRHRTSPGGHAAGRKAGTPEASASSKDDASGRNGLTTLDRLLIREATDTWRNIEGALSREALDEAVGEFAALNGARPQSHFHAGHRDGLLDRPPNPSVSSADPARLRWYWAGVIAGWGRREAWERIVREIESNAVVADFLSGSAIAATEAVPDLVRASRATSRIGDLVDRIRKEAVVAQPEIFRPLVDAATDLLHGGDRGPAGDERLAQALGLFELLMAAGKALVGSGAAPERRALHDAHRRAAHCLRELGQHARARAILLGLLQEEADPNLVAMVESDLGLLDGGFDGMGDVELPVRRRDLEDILDRLARGEDRFRRSAAAEQPYSAHGNYLLGVLRLGQGVMGSRDDRFSEAEDHLKRARTHFRRRGRTYSRAFIQRTDLYFSIARARGLEPDKLAHAARVLVGALEHGARLPGYLVGGTVEAFTLAADEHLRSVVEAMFASGGSGVLDALSRSRDAADNCPPLAQALLRRAREERRSGEERATDFRAALRGFLRAGDLERARECLDGLEGLAVDGIADGEFLTLLSESRRYDPAWAKDEAEIARARIHEARGEYVEALAILCAAGYRAAARETARGLDDALGILERIRGYGLPGDDYEDLSRRCVAMAERLERDPRPGPLSPPDDAPIGPIRVLVVGGDERQARVEGPVREALRSDCAWIEPTFLRTGWTSNWKRYLEAFERRKESQHALVVMRFIRTTLGRRIRESWPGDRPWRLCWGAGQNLLVQTIVQAATAAADSRPSTSP